MKILLALLLAATAHAELLINGNQINPQTKISIATEAVTGAAGLSVSHNVTAASMTVTAIPGFGGDVSNATGLPLTTGVSGVLPIANGGTNLSGAGSTANRVLRTSDGSVFVVGQIIGPDIAGGTIPVSALNQSGAASTNVIAWNGSAWAPSAAAAGNAVLGGTQTWSGSNVFGNSGGPSTTTFNNIGAIGANALGFFSLPLPTIYTSGCNVYTVPTSGGVSARKLDIDMSGGGAGGSAIATNSGVAGSSSTWIIAGSTIAANGGSGDGAGVNGSGGAGGTGGQGGFGVWVSSSVARFPGSSGSSCHSWAAPNNSGWGGASALGGGAGYSTTTGNNAAANSGGGGSGAGSASSNCGAGGGGAEVVRLTILNPTGPYYVCVGAGGPGGAAGTTAGGNGGSGIVIIRPTF